MYTADHARNEEKINEMELDKRIQKAVEEARRYGNRASLRIHIDDPFCYSIKEELEKRGFINIDVPDIIIKGDVEFEW